MLKQLDIGKVLVAKKIKRMQQRIEELEVSQNLFCCNSKVSIFYLQFHLINYITTECGRRIKVHAIIN